MPGTSTALPVPKFSELMRFHGVNEVADLRVILDSRRGFYAGGDVDQVRVYGLHGVLHVTGSEPSGET